MSTMLVVFTLELPPQLLANEKYISDVFVYVFLWARDERIYEGIIYKTNG